MTAEIFGEQGLIVLALIVVLFFGAGKLPELARSLGKAKKEFQSGLDEGAAGPPTDPEPETTSAPVGELEPVTDPVPAPDVEPAEPAPPAT